MNQETNKSASNSPMASRKLKMMDSLQEQPRVIKKKIPISVMKTIPKTRKKEKKPSIDSTLANSVLITLTSILLFYWAYFYLV